MEITPFFRYDKGTLARRRYFFSSHFPEVENAYFKNDLARHADFPNDIFLNGWFTLFKR